MTTDIKRRERNAKQVHPLELHEKFLLCSFRRTCRLVLLSRAGARDGKGESSLLPLCSANNRAGYVLCRTSLVAWQMYSARIRELEQLRTKVPKDSRTPRKWLTLDNVTVIPSHEGGRHSFGGRQERVLSFLVLGLHIALVVELARQERQGR